MGINSETHGAPMKVLWLGVYLDDTGWAKGCIDYILALDSVGVDLVIRPIKLNNVVGQIPQRLKELEAKDSSGCDVVIQQCLPHYLDYNGRFKKNIGFYASETTSFNSSAWAARLNMMDEVWVINDQMVECARNSGVTRPIKVVSHPTDIHKFERPYPPIPEIRNADVGSFIFYTIGEFSRRKNFASLVRAFHSEFDRFEPVSLLIKTSGPHQDIVNFCNQIKEGLKLYPRVDQYKNEMIITDRFTDEQICRVHRSCDAYVSTSYGEAFSIGAFESMGFGNPVIAPNFGGFPMYINEHNGWLVNGHLQPCFGTQKDTFRDLYTARDNWFAIDELELRKAMRECFENKEMRDQKSLNCLDRAYDFTYEKVGKIMKDALDG